MVRSGRHQRLWQRDQAATGLFLQLRTSAVQHLASRHNHDRCHQCEEQTNLTLYNTITNPVTAPVTGPQSGIVNAFTYPQLVTATPTNPAYPNASPLNPFFLDFGPINQSLPFSALGPQQIVGGNYNSNTTGVLESRFGNGNRWEFGYVDTDDYGWLVSILDHVSSGQNVQMPGGTVLFNDPTGFLQGFQTSLSGDFDADLNGDHVFGRNGYNVPTETLPTVTVITQTVGPPIVISTPLILTFSGTPGVGPHRQNTVSISPPSTCKMAGSFRLTRRAVPIVPERRWR